MDRVFIKGLRIETVIGVHDWERRVRQGVVIDLEMAAPVADAAASGALGDALDYEAIGARVRAEVEAASFGLIEALAEHVAALVREEFSVPWVRLRLEKPGALRGASAVGVQIERGDRPG